MMDTIGAAYEDPMILWVYWVIWVFNLFLILLSAKQKNPHYLRICIQIQITRNILAWYDFGGK